MVNQVADFLEEHRTNDKAVIYAGGELGEQIAREFEKHSDNKLIIVRNKEEIWGRASFEHLAEQILKAF